MATDARAVPALSPKLLDIGLNSGLGSMISFCVVPVLPR